MFKYFKRISIVLVLIIWMSLGLTGYNTETRLKPIRLIEVTHSLFYTAQYVAITKGFFEEEGGYIPYTSYSATKSYIEENPEIIQKFTNAIYKEIIWVQEHNSDEIADAVLPQFSDTDKEVLVTLIERYRDQDSWKPDLIITKDDFNHLMDIMELAGKLDVRADYSKIVTTEFAEKAMK